MKKSRFAEPQILAILKESESGMPVPDLCRKHGISNATYYNWRSKYGGIDASLVFEMKAMNCNTRFVFAVRQEGWLWHLAQRHSGYLH